MSHDWSKALGLRKPTEPEKVEQPEPEAKPAPWRPNREDYEEVSTTVKAQHIRSTPLQYGSLADLTLEQIDGIERTAMVGIRKTFDNQGLTLDETTLRAHWAFVVEGYGFPMPEGYIHPEAPPEEAQKAREGWARSVQGAADSVLKQIFLTVWRRRRALPPPPPEPKSIREGKSEGDFEIKVWDTEPVIPQDIRDATRKFGMLPPTHRLKILEDLGVPGSMLYHLNPYDAMHWLRMNDKVEAFIAAVDGG